MQQRIETLLESLPGSTWGAVASPKEVQAILNKSHIHPRRTFTEVDWKWYIVIDENNTTHPVQWVYLGRGDKRNSLWCTKCQGHCVATVAVLITEIAAKPAPSRALVCEGCGQILAKENKND